MAVSPEVAAAQEVLEGRLLCGELGLDGSVRSVRGGLAIADLATREGLRELILPAANAGEAAALGTIPVIPVRSLGGVSCASVLALDFPGNGSPAPEVTLDRRLGGAVGLTGSLSCSLQ